jgi:hypothetical protein
MLKGMSYGACRREISGIRLGRGLAPHPRTLCFLFPATSPRLAERKRLLSIKTNGFLACASLAVGYSKPLSNLTLRVWAKLTTENGDFSQATRVTRGTRAISGSSIPENPCGCNVSPTEEVSQLPPARNGIAMV